MAGMAARYAGGSDGILLVEDDDVIRDALGEILRAEGYEVASVNHGADALERIQAGFHPSLIVTDLMMPVMDGWQLLAALNKRPAAERPPILVISAILDDVPHPVGATVAMSQPIVLDRLLHEVQLLTGT